jgi:hypothetical protein
MYLSRQAIKYPVLEAVGIMNWTQMSAAPVLYKAQPGAEKDLAIAR